MVALAAFERAVSHHVRCGAIGSRTGRFGIRGIHLAPPHSLSMPHILAESLPKPCLRQHILPWKPVFGYPEPGGCRGADVGEGGAYTEVAGLAIAGEEEGDALAGVVRARVGRVVAVVGGDHE